MFRCAQNRSNRDRLIDPKAGMAAMTATRGKVDRALKRQLTCHPKVIA